jgi:hypothetical protein
MALAASSIIAIFFFLAEKHKSFRYLTAGVSGTSAIIASALLKFQMGVYSFCWTCFVSETMFYLIFLFFIFYSISPWLKEKWRHE